MGSPNFPTTYRPPQAEGKNPIETFVAAFLQGMEQRRKNEDNDRQRDEHKMRMTHLKGIIKRMELEDKYKEKVGKPLEIHELLTKIAAMGGSPRVPATSEADLGIPAFETSLDGGESTAPSMMMQAQNPAAGREMAFPPVKVGLGEMGMGSDIELGVPSQLEQLATALSRARMMKEAEAPLPVPIPPELQGAAKGATSLHPAIAGQVLSAGMREPRAKTDAETDRENAIAAYRESKGLPPGAPLTASQIMEAEAAREQKLRPTFRSEPMVVINTTDEAGNPITEVRPRSQAAGTYGKAATNLPAGVQDKLSGLQDALGSLSDVKAAMQGSPTLGAAVGRLKVAEINLLGGAGASPEEIELATALNALYRNRLAAGGGKNLTQGEKEIFGPELPQMKDTFAQALVKIKMLDRGLNRSVYNAIRTLTPAQRKGLPEDLRGISDYKPGTAPPVDAAEYAGQTVRGPDGNSWYSDGKTWTQR